MVKSGQAPESTYGGEVEMLAIRQGSGSLLPFEYALQRQVQTRVADVTDVYEQPAHIAHDSSKHLIEIGGGVHRELSQLLYVLRHSISELQTTLTTECEGGLLSSSYHPFEKPASAYKNVLPKPIYDLFRGIHNDKNYLHPTALQKVYPTHPHTGRGWRHELTALAAATQPWNSLKVEEAAEQIAVMQATGWLFNLLTANSPFAEWKLTGKRDYRLEIWNLLMETSRYAQDKELIKNLPAKPKNLTDYYRYVFSKQRPMIIPDEQMDPNVDYKVQFRAVVQPADNVEFNVFTYLLADSVKVADRCTGNVQRIKPSVAHVFNGCDFLYFPRYGARLRVDLPKGDQIDPKLFANAILEGDETTLRALFIQAGVKEGFMCAEGRVAATVLPTEEEPDWKRFSIPFVLQTAILRTYKEISDLLATTTLTWTELTEVLPALTNSTKHGFKTQIREVHISELAKQIWALAQQSLSHAERLLVGDEIDTILLKQKAPAEDQIAFFSEMSQRHTEHDALLKLITYLIGSLSHAPLICL